MWPFKKRADRPKWSNLDTPFILEQVADMRARIEKDEAFYLRYFGSTSALDGSKRLYGELTTELDRRGVQTQDGGK